MIAFAVLGVLGLSGWWIFRRRRSPEGVDWGSEFGIRYSEAMPTDPRERFKTRLQYAAISVFALSLGGSALWTGHISGRAGRHSREVYTADGAPVYVAGGILCLAGVLLGVAAIFPDADILNRPFGRRRDPS